MPCKGKTIVSYFTAIVVFVILLLVSYNVSVLPNYQHFESVRAQRVLGPRRNSKDVGVKPHRVLETPKLSPLDLIPKFHSFPKQAFLKPVHHSRNRPANNRGPLQPYEYLEEDEEATNNCRDDACLKGDDLQRFTNCVRHVRQMNATPVNGECTFLTEKGRDPVALVSFPGSGNTWVRGLLEEVTGVCTGAVYCDISLRGNGFTGENVRSGSVLAVKTHKTNPLWVGLKYPPPLKVNEGRFGSAIFVVRNPFKAMVAEWSRKVANDFHVRTIHLDTHVKTIGKEWFGDNPRWNTFVYDQSQRWFTMLENWIYKNRKHPVLLVKYEALKNDTAVEIQKILDFLDISYSTEDLQRQLRGGFSAFHRSHSNENFDHFTPEQKLWIDAAIMNATDLIGMKMNFTGYLPQAIS